MITLGFNYSQMHDSSACIARDGELLFAVAAEERISRIKHDAGFPRLAIRASSGLRGGAVRTSSISFARAMALASAKRVWRRT